MIKVGKFLEALGAVDAVAFDKTGTLTEGCPSVRRVEAFSGATADHVLSWSASVEHKSEHPFADAIVAAARGGNVPT